MLVKRLKKNKPRGCLYEAVMTRSAALLRLDDLVLFRRWEEVKNIKILDDILWWRSLESMGKFELNRNFFNFSVLAA